MRSPSCGQRGTVRMENFIVEAETTEPTPAHPRRARIGFVIAVLAGAIGAWLYQSFLR
jgi:hypothetical protein